MGKKKIIVSPDILSEYVQQEELDDISLKFVLSDEYHQLNIDLTKLLDGSLERRKEIHKFKEFLINTPRSLASKKSYYKNYKKMVLELNEDFKDDLIERLKKYHLLLIKKVHFKIISHGTYKSFQSQLRVIFTECFNIKNNDFNNVFPNLIERTGIINNAMILDYKGNEKAFSKLQFKEITKIFINLYDFFNTLQSKRDNGIYKVNFKYQNIYNLDIDLHWKNKRLIQNKKTFCLMVVFISLTGLNLTPLIRLARNDILIDEERKLISFNATCNRKSKVQSHTYPMRENQLKFFQKILANSLEVSPKENILFPFIDHNNNCTYFNHHIDKCYEFFNKGFCGDYIGFNITARKLRHSFGGQFEEIDLRAIALFNDINTAAKSYSTGNAEENNIQLQNAMNIYTIALSNSEDIQIVRENIQKINVLNIKDIAKLKEENSQITSSGIFCINAKEGKEAEKFKKKIEQLKLNNIESINCSNILACFNCKNSIIVNDFENIYILKSFYNYLNNIIYESDTSSLFSDKNAVKNALISIKIILDTKIDKKVIKKVDKHISTLGNHPLWDINGDIN